MIDRVMGSGLKEIIQDRVKETGMAKGQQRSDREAKKPKKDKPKNPVHPSAFARTEKAGAPAKSSGGSKP